MLRNVVAIVSGGASGLGAATVKHIVSNGGKALVADLPKQRQAYDKLVSSLASSNDDNNNDKESKAIRSSISFAETDVTDSNQIEAALDLVEMTFQESINVAISCAGTASAKRTLSKKHNKQTNETSTRIHPMQDFAQALTVNTVGTFNMARLASNRMSDRSPDVITGLRGCIINTSSIAAFDGQIGQVGYAASKGAIASMTLPMARDLSPFGIRVVTIAPGLFQTPLLENLPPAVQKELGAMVPCPSRLGAPDEFGHLVGCILTNSYLNGTIIRLDGALRMPP